MTYLEITISMIEEITKKYPINKNLKMLDEQMTFILKRMIIMSKEHNFVQLTHFLEKGAIPHLTHLPKLLKSSGADRCLFTLSLSVITLIELVDCIQDEKIKEIFIIQVGHYNRNIFIEKLSNYENLELYEQFFLINEIVSNITDWLSELEVISNLTADEKTWIEGFKVFHDDLERRMLDLFQEVRKDSLQVKESLYTIVSIGLSIINRIKLIGNNHSEINQMIDNFKKFGIMFKDDDITIGTITVEIQSIDLNEKVIPLF